MEETGTMSYNQTTAIAHEEENDIGILAKSFMMYKIGKLTSTHIVHKYWVVLLNLQKKIKCVPFFSFWIIS